MSYGLGKLPALGISMFSVVQLKFGLICQMRRSWTISLLGIIRGLEDLGFIVSPLRT